MIFVPGNPAPQGSMRGFVRGGHVAITSDNKKTMPWRADIAAHASIDIGADIVYPEGPVSLTIVFVMPRRKAEPKRLTPPHIRKPDLDKLTRAVMDALTGLVYADDSQVTHLHVGKRTAAIAEQPGAYLKWRRPA